MTPTNTIDLDIFPQVGSGEGVGDCGCTAGSRDDWKALPAIVCGFDSSKIKIEQPEVPGEDDNLAAPRQIAAGDISEGGLHLVKVPPVQQS